MEFRIKNWNKKQVCNRTLKCLTLWSRITKSPKQQYFHWLCRSPVCPAALWCWRCAHHFCWTRQRSIRCTIRLATEGDKKNISQSAWVHFYHFPVIIYFRIFKNENCDPVAPKHLKMALQWSLFTFIQIQVVNGWWCVDWCIWGVEQFSLFAIECHWQLSSTLSGQHLLAVISTANSLMALQQGAFLPESQSKRRIMRLAGSAHLQSTTSYVGRWCYSTGNDSLVYFS